MTEIRCASALSTEIEPLLATRRAAAQCRTVLGGSADAALAFFSPDFGRRSAELAAVLCDELGCQNVIGCTAESLVGRAREHEFEPGISLWAAILPGTTVDRLCLEFMQTPDGGSATGWPEALEQPWPADSAFLFLADPFTFPADWLIERFKDDHPGIPMFGGMASGAATPGENRLIIGNEDVEFGAVGLVLRNVSFRSVVSQGCRPIGHPLIVTRVEANTIQELGGRPAVEQLMSIYDELPNRERELIRLGLHLGRVVSEYQDEYEQGDFLVRNVVGIDRDEGSISIGDYLRVGQTVQFHLRDHQTANAEMELLLARLRDEEGFQPHGGLLFTCNGRGTRFFPSPHHDAALIEQYLNIPLAGFFAAGEIGPIGGDNFVHGYTASLVVF